MKPVAGTGVPTGGDAVVVGGGRGGAAVVVGAAVPGMHSIGQ